VDSELVHGCIHLGSRTIRTQSSLPLAHPWMERQKFRLNSDS
jgi:hypothetical protein